MKSGLRSTLKSNPAIWISLIIFSGLMFSPAGGADFSQIRSGDSGIMPSSKIFRVATVLLAGLCALLIVGNRGQRALLKLFRGNVLLLFLYALIALSTVVFSAVPSITVYKAGELIVFVLIAGVVVSERHPGESAVVFLKAMFIVYCLSVASSLLELGIVGTGGSKQLVGETPLLSTMMASTYPPLVGNGLQSPCGPLELCA